jgi:glycosyltransferase involved in cell wall biosynthesis
LAIGNRGRWCYEKTGFSKIKIFDWGYFTESCDTEISSILSDKISILFIGSIDRRKNILPLVDVYQSIPNESFTLTIVGEGPLKNELNEKIKNAENIRYLGAVPNDRIASCLMDADLLILPSIFDGWGAVINEALMCGVPVIAGDHCGSAILLDNKKRGYVFSVKENNLLKIMATFLKQLPYSVEKRQEIKDWALKSISGEIASDYFVRIGEYIYEQKGNRPIAPWLKENP